MSGFDLPYQPIPQKLYESKDLFAGFDPARPDSWGETRDFEILRHFVMRRHDTPPNPYMGMMQALHDNAVSQALGSFLKGRKVVGIMGDHRLPRNSAAYLAVAMLAHRLAQRGILVCTGGGPGAMEAGHLGAALAGQPLKDLRAAVAKLKTQPKLPDLKNIVDAQGRIDPALAKQAHAWFKPAFELARSINAPRESLAIPTWQYGQEPPTPFATHIAKYFQNSIREDGLLAVATQGIVYFKGKAGTLQEIFQDGAQNFYETFHPFSPMVLFGVEHWKKTYPVVRVLQELFGPKFAKFVLVTDDVQAAALFIEHYAPPASSRPVAKGAVRRRHP